MKRKLLSPSDNCYEILLLGNKIKVNQIKEFTENISQINFPRYSKNQFKKIRNELLELSAIYQDVLINNSFEFPFDPNLINNVNNILRNQKETPLHYSYFILLSYLSWSIFFYSSNNSSGLEILLHGLIIISQDQKQPSDTIICDLAISSFFHAYTLFLDKKTESDDLSLLISPLNDYFLFNKILPDPTYNLLSRLAHEIIIQNTQPQANLECNFYNIVDGLIQFNVSIPTEVLVQILDRSYFSLRRLDTSVLSFLDHSTNLLDDNAFLKFLPILPLALLESIEKSPILTKVPKFDDNRQFVQKPAFLNINYQPVTQSTFDEEPENQFVEFPQPIPLEDMINKKQKVILKYIINILKQKKSLINKFVEDFGPFLIMAQKSEHCYDYFAAFFHICEKLMSFKTNSIDEAKFQENIIVNIILFNPSMTIFTLNSENKDDYTRISTLRTSSLNFFLNFMEKNQIKKVFFDVVSMPYLFAEMVYRLLSFDIDYSNNSIINAITSSLLEPMLFYRSWTDSDKKSINTARKSVLTYFSRIFHNQSILSTFFSNTHFIRFILPLLFEDPLRARVLHYLTIFLTNGTNIKNEITNEIIATLMFITSNVDNVLNSKDCQKSIELMTSIFEIANIVLQKVPSFTQTFEPLASLFCSMMSQVPKEQSYLPLLKIALKFFHYTTDTRMLKFNEMLSLEKGIKNICGDEPDDEVAEILVDLFLNENEINKPSLVYLYLQSFLHSPKLDDCFLKLINLCSLNLENCFSLHDGEIDLLILKYIDCWRVDNSISLPILRHSLQLIEIISSHICSYEIVRKFISLFCPLEGRYYPYYYSQMISSLHLLSLKYSHFPKTYALPLIDDAQINANIPISNSYFSFLFWIFPASNVYKHKKVLKLAENEIALNFDIYGNLLIFSASSNDFKMTYDIEPKLQIGKWSLISCNFTEEGIFDIFLNTDKVSSLNIQRFLFKKQVSVTININQSNNNIKDNRKLFSLFGPFMILNSLDKSSITRLYRYGNSKIQFPNNNNNIIAGFLPIISFGSKFTIENLNSTQFHTNLTHVSISHNFVDVLLTYCKFESLIPLFAQADMTYKDNTNIIGFLPNLVYLFHEILVQNAESQKSFASSSGFLIISHLLQNSDDSHFTFKLFLSFYHFFESLIDKEAKAQLFIGILTNFEIWLKTSAFDHVKILHKLSKMVNKYHQMFVDSLDIRFFITVLQCLYWYVPVETNIARCLNRVRNEKLRIKKCRGYLFKIALKIANDKLTQNDLTAIIGSTTNCGDIEQVSDLLDFILSLIENKIISFDPIFIRLLSIITICQTHLSFKIFKIFSYFNNFDTIVDELLSEYSIYFTNKSLLLKLAKMQNPNLICFCSFIALKQSISNRTVFKLISIYKKNFKNNHLCIDEYEIWTITLLFTRKSLKLQKEIIDYLVQSRINIFTKLFSQVDLISEIFKEISINSNNDNDIILRLLIDKMIDNANESNINQLKQIVIHFVLFRRNDNMNCALEKSFIESPFYDQLNIEVKNHNPSNINFTNSKQFESYINSFNPSQHRNFHFGLHISKNGEWLDSELVQKSLKKLKLSNDICNIFSGLLKRSNDDKNYNSKVNDSSECFKLENFENLQDNFVPEKVQVNQYFTKIKNTIFQLNTYLSMFNIYKEKMQLSAQLWYHFWRSMTIPKAPWHSSLPSDILEELHFKRDNVFCYSFCPFKTRRNFSFDAHMHASFTRDSGNIHQAKEKMNNYLQSKNSSSNDLSNQPISLLNINGMSDDIPHSRENSTDNLLHISNSNKVTFECNCTHITVKESYRSTFKIISDYITIVHSNSNVVKMIEKSSIILVLKRTVLHHQTAIEIFTNVRHSYFINFADNKSQTNVINALKKVLPPKMIQTTSFKQYFSEQSFTNDWKQRKISNFEYLLLLNIYSGRSFNCASQYPIVPWIISDYTSPTIDLNDEKVYRDLSKAIGSTNEHRLKDLVEKQNRLKCIHEDAYLFSSGPVCPLNLFLWLIRLEPFTSLHIKVQGGKFDHAARIFYSIPDSFRVASSHMNDFRELIPEFFYFSEFLVNDNKFDLGKLNGQPINDVELPMWANNNPFEFVYTLRKGIESEYVSKNLNKWIDLIWGNKQKTEENRYKYEMYSDVWQNNPNLEKAGYGTKDGDKKSSIEATLDQVGQIPPQLFNDSHPSRNSQSSQKVSSLKKSIEIDFCQRLSNNEIDQILAVNVTLCSSTVTTAMSNDERSFYNKKLSRSSSDTNMKPSCISENFALSDKNINLDSDSDFSFDSTTSRSKKILKIRFSILNSSGKMATRVVQVNLYLLSDFQQIRYQSKTQNDMSRMIVAEDDKNSKSKSASTNNMLGGVEGETTRTVEQSISLIHSKTLKINDFAFIKKKQSSDQSLIHCFISPSFLQRDQSSCSPSLTLRGIGPNSSSSGAKDGSEQSSNENLSLHELMKEETSSNFTTEGQMQIENDQLFFVGRDRTDVFIANFDMTDDDSPNNNSNNNEKETNNDKDKDKNNSNSNIHSDSYSPKSYSLPYDIVCAASDGFWTAVCGKDAVIRLFKRNNSNNNNKSTKSDAGYDEVLGEFLNSGKAPVHSISSFCNSIVCCDVWTPFDTMVCGTKDASLMICSLSRGVVTYDIDMKKVLQEENRESYIDNFVLKKMMITPSWGFILTCIDAIKKEDGKVVHFLSLFNINGNLIRSKEIDFVVDSWSSWCCNKGFDYVLLSDDNGKLFMFEAFYLNVSRPFYRCQGKIVSVKYIIDEMIVVAVSKDGRVFFIPYSRNL